jgi:hypothetical protein
MVVVVSVWLPARSVAIASETEAEILALSLTQLEELGEALLNSMIE